MIKESILYIIIILLLMILSYTDIKERIISNKVVLSLLVFIIPLTYMKYEQVYIVPALMSLIIGFLLFTLKVIGAGDVKLITVLMLIIPHEQIISFFFFISFSGLILIIIGWLFFRESVKTKGLPYGVAISSGFLANLVLFGP